MRRRLVRRDGVIRVLAGVMAASSAVAMLAIFFFLLGSSLPSIRFNGLGFLTRMQWSIGNLYGTQMVTHGGISAPPGASYGILPFIVGTLASSAIAIVLAVPVSLGTALLLSEHLPRRWSLPVSFVVELLAGVPSVVFGLWGLVVVVPWVAHAAGPWLSRWLGFLPIFRGPVGSGQGLFTSGLVLAIMIIPIITATVRDVLSEAPADVKEGAVALGFTRWETIRAVSLPWARVGIMGAVILGLGRALGETMAVLMISGNAVGVLPANIYSPISTMAAVVVSQLDAAFTDASGMAVHALAETSLVLFLITVAVSIPARILITRQLHEGGGRA